MDTAENRIETPAPPALTVERGGQPSAGDLLKQILGAPDAPPEAVSMAQFAGWPAVVWLKRPTATGLTKWETSGISYGKKGKVEMVRDHMREELIALMLVDATGSRVFTETKHVRALGAKDSAPVDYLYGECRRVAGIDDEDERVILEATEEALGFHPA
jgi:hypothetical protein